MADARQRYLQMPMPPGWEVKYDFSSRKYFYIDHNTKCTAWEDPRPAYYARLERQQGLSSPQRSSDRFSHAVSSLNSGGGRNLGGSSPARRPETIQLQQVPKETDIDAEDHMPTLSGDEYEIAVLESKFPNASKDQIKKALKSAGGQIGRATDILRQQVTDSAKVAEKEREFASKSRSLSADFPQFSHDAILTVLRENDGNMYKTKEKLRSNLEAKTQTLVKKYPNVQLSLIKDLQKEAATRSDGDTYLERRLEFLQAEAAPPASGSTTPRQRHPSPQPRSTIEGEDSLERQRAHRQLVESMMREFPRLERALVRTTLASVNWSVQKGREKLQLIRASVNGQGDRSASPASSINSVLSPNRSRGPSPHATTSQVTSTAVTVVNPTPKPNTVKKPAKKKAKQKKERAFIPPPSFTHPTLAKGADPTLRVGPNKSLAHGPDLSLRHGPDPALRTGADPQLSRGCDPELRLTNRTRE